MKFETVTRYAGLIYMGVNALDKIGDTFDKIETFKERISDSSLFKSVDKDISYEELRQIENIYKIINVLKDINNECINEQDKKLGIKHIVLTAGVLCFPIITTASFIGIKGYKGCKQIKEKYVNNKTNSTYIKIFVHLYNELGFDEKMNDVLYIPTIEEVMMLKDAFSMNTGGQDLLATLITYISK